MIALLILLGKVVERAISTDMIGLVTQETLPLAWTAGLSVCPTVYGSLAPSLLVGSLIKLLSFRSVRVIPVVVVVITSPISVLVGVLIVVTVVRCPVYAVSLILDRLVRVMIL